MAASGKPGEEFCSRAAAHLWASQQLWPQQGSLFNGTSWNRVINNIYKDLWTCLSQWIFTQHAPQPVMTVLAGGLYSAKKIPIMLGKHRTLSHWPLSHISFLTGHLSVALFNWSTTNTMERFSMAPLVQEHPSPRESRRRCGSPPLPTVKGWCWWLIMVTMTAIFYPSGNASTLGKYWPVDNPVSSVCSKP